MAEGMGVLQMKFTTKKPNGWPAAAPYGSLSHCILPAGR